MSKINFGIDTGRMAAFAIGALVAVLVFAGGVAFASNDGKVHACVDEKGKPTFVQSSAECKDKDTFLSWNIEGPLSGYEQVITTETIPANQSLTVHAVCSVGKTVLGGGFSSATANAVASFPTVSGNSAWRVDFRNSFGTPVVANVFAICANVN